jgi:uncharacterized cupin superfamily protein
VTEVYNLLDGELKDDPDRAGYCQRWQRIGPLIGASKLGLSIYELAEGERICPYHFEWPDEEWLLVLDGEPTLRAPDGEHTLAPWDVVSFPPGPEGAHAVTGPARVAMLSTKSPLGVAEYPDSDKIGIWTGESHLMLRRTPHLDYWDGEA